MVKSTNLTQQHIGNINRMKILNTMRKKGAVTKQELSSGLKLSHTTINSYIQTLTDQGMVETVGDGESIGGRKPAIIRLVKDAQHFIGVYFAPGTVKVLLVDMLGQEEDRQEFTFGCEDHFESVLDNVYDAIQDIQRKNQLKSGHVRGVGMTFPGVVDRAKNFVEYAPNLGIRTYSLNDFMEKLDIKLTVENEAVAAARAETFIGSNGNKSNIVYVSIAEGIGTGVIIHNSVYKSFNQKAGEFGHVRIADKGMPCKCGRHDCWELYGSKDAILRYYVEAGPEPHPEKVTIDDLAEAYSRKQPAAVTALEIYARALFRGLETIMLALSPEEIIVGGDLGALMPHIIEIGTEQLKLNETFYGYEDIPIRPSIYKENAAVIGSALMPLEEIYNYEEII